MPLRPAAEIVSVLVVTALLVILGFALLELSDGVTPAEAFLSAGPRTAVGFAGIGFAVTALAAIVGGLLARARPRKTRLLVSLLAGAIGAIVNVAVGVVLGVTGGGWSALLIAFSLIGAVILAVAVLIASLVVYLVVFRRAE